MSQQYCGGTEIAPAWVLTAAHFLGGDAVRADPTDGLVVLVGELRLGGGGTTIPVAAVFPHPRYDPDTFDFDVALLQLASAVPAGEYHPVALVAAGDARLERPGTPLTVMGWWLASDSDPAWSRPRVLQQARLVAVSDRRCGKPAVYGPLFKKGTMLCAGWASPVRDACHGDSGGPLLATVPGGVVQVGVVSCGNGCGRVRCPGVSTQLSNQEISDSLRQTAGLNDPA